nr:Trk system potassium transporter TrkA [Desulfurispora thermophila]
MEVFNKMKITVIGAGKVGLEITRRLIEEGHDVVVVDRDESKLTQLSEHLDVMTLRGSGSSAMLLSNAAIAGSDLLVAVTSSDEINMIACMTAKRVGIARTIARVRDPEYAHELIISKEDLGIDLVINPEYAAALEIVRLLTLALPVHLEPFANGKVQLLEVTLDETHTGWVNRKIKDLVLPEDLLLVGISRQGEMIIPSGKDMLLPGDHLYWLGKAGSIEKLGGKFKRKQRRLQNIIIMGGGRIAYYLADHLSDRGMRVKIIEQNPQRCEELAEKLPGVLVLRGDGTDVDLLKREGIRETDGFIAVTGIDEENLLIALLAKQLGAKRVIAKVSRPSYAPLVEKLGVDAAISPRLITIGEILRFIRGGRLLSLVLLLNEQAEVMELIVQGGSKLANKVLAKAGLPRGVIVGAISRDNRIIIPRGQEMILPEDRLVVFALGHNVHLVEAMCAVGGIRA